MDNVHGIGPLGALFRGAGWVPVEDTRLLSIDVDAVIERSLEGIGLPMDKRPRFRAALRNWACKSKFRPPSRGTQIEARQLAGAIKRLESALAEADAALQLIHNARAANIGVRTNRDAALAAVQSGVLSAIGESLMSAMGNSNLSSPSEVDVSMPSYRWGASGFENDNRWQGLFRCARDRLAQFRKRFAASAFALTAHDQNPWRAILIQDLASLYHEATGKPAKSPERTATQPPDYRNKFQQFVVDLWPLLGGIGVDEADVRRQREAPSNKIIRGALELRTE